MSRIWKCGYCNEQHTQKFKIDRHESKCASNPGNRLCYSCNNYRPGSKNCIEGIQTFNIYTSGVACIKWMLNPEKSVTVIK